MNYKDVFVFFPNLRESVSPKQYLELLRDLIYFLFFFFLYICYYFGGGGVVVVIVVAAAATESIM